MTTGAGTSLVNVLTGNLQVGNGSPNVITLDGEDVYFEGNLEIDGTVVNMANAALTVSSCTGCGGTNFWQENAGALTPYSTTLDVNFGATATSSAKVNIAGSLTRGKSALIINQTELTDLFTASASGISLFRLTQTGPEYMNAGRPSKKITLSPEYPGAVLTASASGTITGSMTSDASPSAQAWRNYYQWTSTEANIQDYTVAVRVTLPADFDAWATSNALQFSYNTALATTDYNKLDIYVYNDTDTVYAPVYFSTANASAEKTWTTITVDDSTLDDNVAPDWDAAGETAVIYLKMYGRSNTSNYTQIGDIVLNYLSKF